MRSTAKLARTAAAAALLALPHAGWTAFDPVNDDTDIFLANPAFNATRPNVLIFLDNTANWAQSTGGTAPMDTKYGAVTTAIKNVLNGVVTDNFNVGLALFVETGAPNNNTDGAYLRYGIRQMTTTNKNVLLGVLSSLDINGDKGNGAVYSLASAEIFKYFAGTASVSGHGKNKADAGGTVFMPAGRIAHSNSPLAVGALPAPAGSSATQTYTSPIIDSCQKNFVVFISNGEANDNASALSTAQGMLSAIVGTSPPATIGISPSGEQGLWSDEYAKYMANGDCNPTLPGVQNVLTYTVDVMPKSTGQGPDHTAMLKSMAINGKGKYFPITDATNTAELENAFKSIFAEVQSVNSVFASTTLPVSVNVRGTNLNQVYIGVFRPDENKAPRWLGNLKLYKLGVDTATQNLFLADAGGLPAENASTGFISTNATSFWSATSCFWQYRGADPNNPAAPPASCPSTPAYAYWSDKPDGNAVEKGGAAQKIRAAFPTSNAARKLYTCQDGSGNLCNPGDKLSSSPFIAANVAPVDVNAYLTYNIASLTWDSTTKLATMTLASAPNPAWSTGNTVRVSGVQPTIFNGDFPVTQVNVADPLVWTYPLFPGPDGTRGRITEPNHLMQTGDAAIVFPYDCTAAELPFWSWILDVTCSLSPTSPRYKTVTVVNANEFDYDLNGTGTITLPQYTFDFMAGRQISSVRGRFGTNTVLITVPNHGFGGTGTIINSGNSSWLYAAYDPITFFYWHFEWYSACCQLTVVDADTLSGPVPTITNGVDGATPNFTQVNVPNHPYGTNMIVSVTGSTVPGYNGAKTITRFDGNSFGFPSTLGLDDAANANVKVGAVITNISRPTTSGGASNCTSQSVRDTATVTTATPHNLQATAGFRVNIYGTGGAGPLAGYDGNWQVQQVLNATQFTIIDNCFDTGTAPTNLNPANALAGYAATPLNALQSITTTNQTISEPTPRPIHVWRPRQGFSDRPLSNGSGVMIAGRPADASTALRDQIVNWARSTDNKDNENIDCTVSPFFPCTPTNNVQRLTDVRGSAHGDVLHSRPATINYNRYGDDNDIYAYYGSNDGILHAVKGGISTHTTGPDTALLPGTERWGFVPKEFWPKLKRLRDNLPIISNFNQKDYFFDGSIGVYLKDAKGNGKTGGAGPLNCVPGSCGGADTVTGVLGDNIEPTAGDKVQLYLTLRRGGDFMYSLDILDPAEPKLQWRRGVKDKGWTIMGQTWSEPKIFKTAANLGNSANPDNVVVIFGAGYDDKVEDINPCLIAEWYTDRVVPKAVGGGTVTYTATGSCTITGGPGGNAPDVFRTVGRGLMVIDAMSGDVVWQASAKPDPDAALFLEVPQMTCAISSDVTVLDKDRNGTADRLYVGDTCGQLWRADISDADPKNWSVTLIATLSDISGDPRTISDKLKFLFPPDLVFAEDSSGFYTAVLLGSGDREHPFDATVQNAFFMIKDRDFKSLLGALNNTTVSISSSSPDSSLPAPLILKDLFDATNAVVDNSTAESLNGWFILLGPGEKAVGSAVTIAGTTFFNTNQPSATAGGGACGSNLGIAREYLVGFADAGATVDLNGLGTLSIANRSTIHAGGGYLPSPVPVVVEIDGKKYQAVISGTSVQTPPGLTLEKLTRAFWYKQID